jgi:hypothetical protein
MAKRQRTRTAKPARVPAALPVEPVPVASVAPRTPLLERLHAALRGAQRSRRNSEAEAINSVIVGLSDARHKAKQARAHVTGPVAAMFAELETL